MQNPSISPYSHDICQHSKQLPTLCLNLKTLCILLKLANSKLPPDNYLMSNCIRCYHDLSLANSDGLAAVKHSRWRYRTNVLEQMLNGCLPSKSVVECSGCGGRECEVSEVCELYRILLLLSSAEEQLPHRLVLLLLDYYYVAPSWSRSNLGVLVAQKCCQTKQANGSDRRTDRLTLADLFLGSPRMPVGILDEQIRRC